MKSMLLIAAALRIACPSMGPGVRIGYARVIQETTTKAKIDPFLVVAIVAHESRGIATADNGKCVGLGQVCLSTQSACADGLDKPECLERRAELMDGATNLRVVVGMLEAWKKQCVALTGKAETRHVLSGYAGTDKPGHIQCGQIRKKRGWKDAPIHPIVGEILDIYKKLKNGIR